MLVNTFIKKINLNQKIKFGHGKIYSLKNGIKMVGCYHPSPRNVNTGRINEKKWFDYSKKLKILINYNFFFQYIRNFCWPTTFVNYY